MKLRVVAVGKDRSGLFAPAVDEYAKRLSRYAKFELVEVSEAKRHAGTPRAKEEEGETLLAKLGPTERVILLDERGDEPTSVALAQRLAKWLQRGQDLTFVIGGSDGHAEAIRARAQETLSLSRMTMAHRLARVVLLEQLYRAFTILKGEPYHK